VAERSPASSREQAGARALKNVGVRALAEILGKLTTLVLFAAMAREFGQARFGVFIFALAYLGIVTTPVGLGMDPYLLRAVAADRTSASWNLLNVVALKLVVGIPVVALSLLALWPLGFGALERATVAVLSLSVLLDLVGRSFHALFNAVERGELLAVCLVAQRVVGAGLGLGLLVAGGGLVALAGVFAFASALQVVLATILVRRFVPLAAARPGPAAWRAITRRSLPFAAQDVFTVLLFRIDAVLLALIATDAAVGRYGAAYRLLDATLFISWSLNGAFAAMYVYLDRHTEPSLGGVFGRSLKFGLVLLVPIAVTFAVLAEPICVAIFGEEFRSAAPTLRLLAPVVVLIGLVALSTSLIVSRRPPGIVARLTAAMVVVNVVLNVVLIPALEDRGAALAMLATELPFAAIVLVIAQRAAGGVRWGRTATAPIVSGTLMAGAMAVLAGLPLVALIAGAVTYLTALTALERRFSPGDLELLARVLKRRVGGAR
jgi:O-antigen/teichoic acid export membrane protein